MRMWQCYLRIALRARSASGLLDALGLGYDLPVGQAVYAIDAFPDDDLLWRIEWIGGLITRAFRANRESMFAWRSSLLARRTHSAPDRGAPLIFPPSNPWPRSARGAGGNRRARPLATWVADPRGPVQAFGASPRKAPAPRAAE